jgi:hypothetical protein
MIKRRKNPNALPDGGFRGPFRHENHPRPVTRRELLGAGFLSGSATILAPAWVGALLKVSQAKAAGVLDTDLDALTTECNIASAASAGGATGPVPFITIDCAGGMNMIGSEALVGVSGGQMNLLSTAGYGKLGLPATMIPTASTNFSTVLGLAFHSDSAMLRGILSKLSAAGQANVNGVVIPAISQNDTGNNTLNAVYGVAKAAMFGAGTTAKTYGSLITLAGTQSSVSGGNSMSPATLVDPTLQPTKISKAQDDVGLVSSGASGTSQDTIAALQSQVRISAGASPKTAGDPFMTTGNGAYTSTPSALDAVTLVQGNTDANAALKDQVRCAYLKNANTAASFSSPNALNPTLDTNIVAPSGAIFTTAELSADSDLTATAAVMKLVMNGYAGAATIALGGFDYHDSTRATGEVKNQHAGEVIGAILEYAHRVNSPVMIQVISDGSLVSTGKADTSTNGRNKFGWQGDNQQVAASILLVYSPKGRPVLTSAAANQIGYMNTDGTVNPTSSPAANANNLLVQTVMLNYMALNGTQAGFTNLFTTANLGAQGLGSAMAQAALTSFTQII